jgi:3-hydroxyisobutyrate dehydrogenase-like beta-hydroxyacid dehydrogenase
MRLGSRLGVSLDPLREALLMSSGSNWALETWTRSRPMPWAEEDMRVLRSYAGSVGLELPLAEAVEREITAIKQRKNAWTAGGGSRSSMDAFTRSLP